MTDTIITALVGVVCTIASGFGTFLFTKRKYNEEVDSYQIKNFNESMELYKKVTQETIDTLYKRMDILQKENDDLKTQVEHLQRQMIQLIQGFNSDSIEHVKSLHALEPGD